MSKVILCDVDGTLSNGNHRQHYLAVKPKNWMGFIREAPNDPPYEDIVWLIKTLKDVGNKILIVTARSEDEREMTKTWLDNVAGLAGYYEKMYMRESKDYRDDSIVKKEILENIRLDGYDPYMVLDDRNKVVSMWRSLGIRCLQVQDGDF